MHHGSTAGLRSAPLVLVSALPILLLTDVTVTLEITRCESSNRALGQNFFGYFSFLASSHKLYNRLVDENNPVGVFGGMASTCAQVRGS